MQTSVVISNVTLSDGVEGPQQADVLMQEGRFAAIARPGALAAVDAKQIDGHGKYLVPGLWESHTHMMLGVDGSFARKVDGVKKGLQTYLARGITSVVDLGCPEDVMNTVRSEIGKRQSDYPSFYFAGPVFTGINGWPLCMTCDHTSSWEITPDSPVETMVGGLAGKVDFIKIIYDGLPGGNEKFPQDALARVIRAAHGHGKRVMVHVRSKNDIVEAVEAGADCIEHIFQPESPDNPDEAEEAAGLMAQHGVFWCPTVTTYEQIGHLGSIAYLERLREDGIITIAEMAITSVNPFYHHSFPRISADEGMTRVDYSLRTLRLFAERGVRLVAGRDIAIAMSRPAAVLRELQLFAQAGLDPATILRSATTNAAERLGLPKGTGSIAEGAMADAMLLTSDPIRSIDALVRPEHVETVFKAGVAVS
jgi:imidazolonepropionase-like amidohydrolase